MWDCVGRGVLPDIGIGVGKEEGVAVGRVGGGCNGGVIYCACF